MHHIHLKYQIKHSLTSLHLCLSFFLHIAKTAFTHMLSFWTDTFAPFLSFISLFLAFFLSHLHYLTFPSHTAPHYTLLFTPLFFLPLLGSFIISYVPIIYFVNHSTLPFFLAQSDVLFCFSLSAPIPKRDGLFWACYISIVSLLIADWQTLIYVMRWCGLNRMESNFLTW